MKPQGIWATARLHMETPHVLGSQALWPFATDSEDEM